MYKWATLDTAAIVIGYFGEPANNNIRLHRMFGSSTGQILCVPSAVYLSAHRDALNPIK